MSTNNQYLFKNLDIAVDKLTAIFNVYLDAMETLGLLNPKEKTLAICIFKAYMLMELCSSIPEIVPLEKEVPDRYQLLQRTALGRFSSRDSLEVNGVQGIGTDIAGKVNHNNRLNRVKVALAARAAAAPGDAAAAQDALETVLRFLGAVEVSKVSKVSKGMSNTVPYRLVVPNQTPKSADYWPTFIANPGLIDPNNIPAVSIEYSTNKHVNAHVLPIKATVYKNETLRRCLQLSDEIFNAKVDIGKIMSAFYDNLLAIHIGKEVNYSDLFLLQMVIGKTPEAGGQASRIAMASIVEAAKQCYKSVEANPSKDAVLDAICKCIETTTHSITAAAFTGNIPADDEALVKSTRRGLRSLIPPDTAHITAKLEQRKNMIRKWLEPQETVKVAAASSSKSDMDTSPIYALASDQATKEAIAKEQATKQATDFAETSAATEWLEKELLLQELEKLMGPDLFENIFEELKARSTGIDLESVEDLLHAHAEAGAEAEAEADLYSPSQEYPIEEEAGAEELADAEDLPETETDCDPKSSKRSRGVTALLPPAKVMKAPSIKRLYSEVVPDERTQIELSERIRNGVLARTEGERLIPKCAELHMYFKVIYGEIFNVEVVDLQPITYYIPVPRPVLTVLKETKSVSDYLVIINSNLLQWIGQLLQRGVALFTKLPDTCSALMQGSGPIGYIMHSSSSKILQHRALMLLMRIITEQNNALLLTIIFDIISSNINPQDIAEQPPPAESQIKGLLDTTKEIADLASIIMKDFGKLSFLVTETPRESKTRSAPPFDCVRLAVIILDNIKKTLQQDLPQSDDKQGGAIMDYNMNANAKLPTKKKKLGSNKTKKSKTKKSKNKKPKHKKPKKHKTKNAKNYKSFFNKTLKKY